MTGQRDPESLASQAKSLQWLTPFGMGAVDASGKLGAGGEFAKQVTQWMTPSVVSATDQEYTRDGGIKGQERLALLGQAKLVTQGWPTPSQRDGDPRRAPTKPDSNAWKNKVARGAVNAAGMLSDDLSSSAASWPTPKATDGTKGGPNQMGSKGDLMLPSAAAQWPTPAARDYRSEAGSEEFVTERQGQVRGQSLSFVVTHSLPQDQQTQHGPESSPATRTSPRRLNPAFGCWLMGLTWWWTNPGVTSFAKSEMAAYRSRLDSHLSSLLNAQGSSVEWREAA